MSYLLLGFITGLSLILAIGAQNIFVIEQGLKREFTFVVCLICALSDLILIFLGIFIFYYFQNFFTPNIELILNLLLIIFLLYFIWNKIRTEMYEIILRTKEKYSLSSVALKTLGFTYLNPHVYSDTVFFLGNFSKDFILKQKIFFGFGASVASIIFFFTIGYTSKYLSRYIITKKFWKIINLIIIIFMSFLTIYVIKHTMQYIFINGR